MVLGWLENNAPMNYITIELDWKSNRPAHCCEHHHYQKHEQFGLLLQKMIYSIIGELPTHNTLSMTSMRVQEKYFLLLVSIELGNATYIILCLCMEEVDRWDSAQTVNII